MVNKANKSVFRSMRVAVAILLLHGVVHGQNELLNHPVFAKYPSRQELEQRIDNFRQEHPKDYSAAWEDLKTGVRFNLEIRRPHVGPQPAVIPKWKLFFPPLRQNYDGVPDSKRVETTYSAEFVEYLRKHVDELTLEGRPALRFAALNVFLNGWNDWSGWDTPRLHGYRERYPELDRIAAYHALAEYRAYQSQKRGASAPPAQDQDPLDPSGVFLQMLVDPDTSYDLRKAVANGVERIQNDVDALDLVVKAYIATDDPKIQYLCLGPMGSLGQTISTEQRLEFWLSYVDVPNAKLRGIAVAGVGDSRRRPRDVPLAQHPDRQIVSILRRIAEEDPDPGVRRHALHAIDNFTDDSPPRGLIQYGNDK